MESRGASRAPASGEVAAGSSPGFSPFAVSSSADGSSGWACVFWWVSHNQRAKRSRAVLR